MCRRARLAVFAPLALLSLLLVPACADDATTGGVDVADGILEPDTLVVDTSVPADTIVVIDTSADTAGPVDTGGGSDVEGGFGAPCQGNVDCLDGFCVEGEEGFFCTKICEESCPDGMDCKSVLTAGADPVFLCLPRLAKVCVPCKSDFQCTGGACLEIDGAGQCAISCEGAGDCPTGYDCAADPAGVRSGDFCQPRSGSCDCTPELDGAQRTCVVANDVGTCYGVETCDAETGWGGCNARTPAEDLCDGLDNDCNGLVDDGVEDGGACNKTIAGVGTCHGVEVCLGPQGLVCSAPTPEAETCDFKDNDCDGGVDEDFKDASGEWTTTANCGTCGNDCSTKIPHGVGRCEAVGQGSPVCVVDHCDADYVAINQFQCSLPPDVSCQPCAGDDDCFGGSCVDLDGQRVCVSPCGGAARSCGDGYACQAVGSGGERCLPVTGSCVCNATTDGQARACVRTNAAGTCFGQEVCDAMSGWSGCNAREPAAEVCDGVDNDCNGVADDGVVPPTEPCENAVAGVGTCTGTWFCASNGAGGVAWTCNAATPEPEVCDFRDNDCDGQVDEGYKDQATGVYGADDACGSCGVSCDTAVPHASAGCLVSAGVARCEVLECDPGYYQAGPLTCLPVTEDLCTPCATDAQCPTPGDRCLDLDGGRFCGRDCGATNLHGTAAGVCPSGFGCQAVPGGADQCVPATGSCSCLAGDVGEQRTCIRSNALGTCYGQETCAAGGWSSCTVAAPVAEVCNGRDDDCNSAIDDVAGRGQACSITNANGTCPGVKDCPASGAALVCVGKTPAAESCNYADDDCNGVADDPWAATLFQSCSKGQGVCQRFGFMACKADGSGVECNAQPGPQGEEICDGLDNDCDGETDEGPWDEKGQPCTAGLGVCQVTGVKVCSPDGATLVCSATPPAPGTSDPCDGLDNDCNGVVDDAFAAQKGAVCSNGQGVCKAFGNLVCGNGGASLVCNATEGTGTPEVCDLVDNDCDGATDNGFQVGGRYVSPTACGNCFTNCEAIFGVGGGYGTCNTTPPLPVCALKCCRAGDTSHGCDGGNYFDLNGVPGDGCEFVVDTTAVYVATTDSGAVDDGTCGLAPTVTGLGHPCKSITKGIARAAALSRGKVLVASGQYTETVTVVDGVSLYGGYSAQTWQRATDLFLTAVTGNTASGHRVTLNATDITTKNTVVDGFTIYGQTATGVAENSYAVLARRSNQRLTLTHNVVWAGAGGPGDSGTRGGDGTNGGGGVAGHVAFEAVGTGSPYYCWRTCNAAGASNAGGNGGTNGSCSAANGGKGGTGDCPDYNNSVDTCINWTLTSLQTQTTKGVNGQGASPGAGGVGGCDSLIDPYALDGTCDCKPAEFDAAQCPNGTFSAAGTDGGKGSAGSAGTRCSTPAGQLVSGHWQGNAGSVGGAGGAGSGGGGGGAGGGVEQYNDGSCTTGGSDFGGSGGGGGAGGCGGGGGTAGKAGGGAFGIFVVFETNPGTAVPAIRDNTIHTGYGGVGGRGGEAGTPGTGGSGGGGGGGGVSGTNYWCASPGSKGGEGGDGGPGGGGGGGCGGASYGVWVGGPYTASNLSGWTNAVTLDGAGGAGGPGGQTTAGGNKGQDGLAGTHALKNY